MPAPNGSKVLLVRIGDRQRKSSLRTGLDQVLEQLVGHTAAILGVQVELVCLAGNDERPWRGAIKGPHLAAIALVERRVLVADTEVQSEPVGDFPVILHKPVPVGAVAAKGLPRVCPGDRIRYPSRKSA